MAAVGSASNTVVPLETLAAEKMTRVLGTTRAQKLFAEIMEEIGLEKLSTPEELLKFAKALSLRPGFEGTVGNMLAVTAILRGARAAEP